MWFPSQPATSRENDPDPGANRASRTAVVPGSYAVERRVLERREERLADLFGRDSDSGLVTPESVANLQPGQVKDAAGVDTWVLGFRTPRRPPAHRFKLGQYDCMWYPHRSLVTLDGHPMPGALCPGELLAGAYEQAYELVQEVVGKVDPTGMNRLDSTAQISLGGADGLAALRGFASVVNNLPRIKPEVIGKPVETVYMLSRHGKGAKLGRGYDPFFRGVSTRGEAARFEAQDRRLDLDYGLNALTPRERFHRRFGGVWAHSKDVTVGGFPVITAKLSECIADGRLTPSKAMRLGGYLVMEAGGLDMTFHKSTRSLYRRRLLEVGIALADDGLFEPVEVNLGEVFERAMDGPWL